MHSIFRDLSVLYQSFVDGHLTQAEYLQTKHMVYRCKQDLIKRYGSVEQNEYFKSSLNQIDSLYFQIDSRLLEYSDLNRTDDEELKFFIENLFQNLFDLDELCKDVDHRFESQEIILLDSQKDNCSDSQAKIIYDENSEDIFFYIDPNLKV